MSDLSDLIHKITNDIREKYNYTDEQLMAYFQGMEDSAVESMESYNKQSKILNDTVEELVEAKRLLKSAIDEWNLVCEWGDCGEYCGWYQNGRCTQE